MFFKKITDKCQGLKIAAGLKVDDGVGIRKVTSRPMYSCVKSK